MNKVVLMGRLTKDPDVRYTESQLCVARYTLAVDRRSKEKETDFISCVAFGKSGEFAEKFLKKGMKIAVEGRIQTGSYNNKEGNKVYTTNVVVDQHEFAESKNAKPAENKEAPENYDGFMEIPEGMEEELPFA